MLERQLEGIAKAKDAGKYKGRKPTVAVQAEAIKRMHAGGTKPALASSQDAAKPLSLIKSYCPIGIAITLLRLIGLVQCRAAASPPDAELPLPLLDGPPDRPDDAATVAVVENVKRPAVNGLTYPGAGAGNVTGAPADRISTR